MSSITKETVQEQRPCSVLFETSHQLDQYFAGERKNFDLKLDIRGTAFQQKCWAQLSLIPYGETWSYLQQAMRVKNSRYVRAVARANGSNPLPLIIPCHRIIGKNGDMVGFAWGVAAKQYLLNLEKAHS